MNSPLGRGVFTVLFPSDCRLCGVPLTNISRLPVCPGCLSAIKAISTSTCPVCGERVPSEFGDRLCSACEQTPPNFIRACAYGAYDGQLRELIHLLKYEQVTPAAAVLGAMLAQAIRKLEIGGESVLVVPVPLHRSKRRQRGFNQSQLIGQAALNGSGLINAQLAADVLERVRPTLSQIGLTRPQRAENIRGAFRIRHLNKVSGRCVLLVDDVLTTGTTANECARILKKGGAEKIWVATVARTLKETGAIWANDDMFRQQSHSGGADEKVRTARAS